MTVLDGLVIAIYAALIIGVGFRAARRGGDNASARSEYFLAGRTQGWASVAASTWATKLSALTFIGVPGAAISGNFAYAQLWFGSFAAAYLVALVFIPEFYRFRVFTVYEYLERRIGPETRLGGTVLFIISRCMASGVRLAACAIAVSVFFDLTLTQAIGAIVALATIYVLVGGLRAVIWTDAVQLGLFLVGAGLTIAYVGAVLPGGVAQIYDAGAAANKFEMFDFRFDLNDAGTFWVGNLFALILGLAVGAADQDIAQRALACRNKTQARIALITAGLADLFSTFLFLTAGVAVFAFYQAFPQEAVTALLSDNRADYVFPHFIRHELPAGVRGLLVAALFAAAMSSLDSALSGLASSAYFDLRIGGPDDTAEAGTTPQVLVVVFALLLGVIAYVLGSQPSILWLGFQMMGYTYGGLLGLFVVAYLAPAGLSDRWNVIAALTSIPVVVALTSTEAGFGLVAWPWSVSIGLVWTVGLALAATLLRPRATASP